MSENLKRILREEIACHDAQLFTTPHLSRIRHAQEGLLALLEETDRRPAARKDVVPLRDVLTLVEVLDGRGPLS